MSLPQQVIIDICKFGDICKESRKWLKEQESIESALLNPPSDYVVWLAHRIDPKACQNTDVWKKYDFEKQELYKKYIHISKELIDEYQKESYEFCLNIIKNWVYQNDYR